MKQIRKVVGIDLGMTFSAIAHVNDHGEPQVIPNDMFERRTPSVIMFDDDVITVGKIAKQNASAVPEQIVEFVKRDMGKPKGEYSREFNGKEYSAEELSALILQKLKQDAEAELNAEVTDAVITVPAYFNDAEREATRNAGKMAGLNVLQILNEPTAAALAYGIGQHGSDQTVFVLDLGDGTLDVTIMRVYGSHLEMIATNGDHRLGGKDWDNEIIKYVAESFAEEHGVKPLQDLHAYQEIQLSAISAKEALSQRQKVNIRCSYDGKGSTIEITREKFEELTANLVIRCSSLCDIILDEAGMTWEDIDTVLMVGGSTHMPMVQEMVAKISGKDINPREVNLDDAVALGAAIQGTLHQLQEVVIGGKEDTIMEKNYFEVLKLDIKEDLKNLKNQSETEFNEFKENVKKNFFSEYSLVQKRAQANERAVTNPAYFENKKYFDDQIDLLDQAKNTLTNRNTRDQHIDDLLKPKPNPVLIPDPDPQVDPQPHQQVPRINIGATPNLGFVFQLSGGEEYIHVIIPKMTPLPCEVKFEFRTAEKSQTLMRLKVVQGLKHGQREDEFIKFENYLLGEISLKLPSNLPVGSSIDITFKLNLEQLVEVTAQGPDGRTVNVTIDRPTLDEAEVTEVSNYLRSLEDD